MTVPLLEISLPIMAIVAAAIARSLMTIKYPPPRALGRVLPQLCVVDSDEILRYNEIIEEECRSKPHLRRALRRNQIRINSSYLSQMRSNTLLFQQVVRFEQLKIDGAKSSFEYEPREILVMNLIDESARLRSEVFQARIGLLKRALLGRMIGQEHLEALLGTYKSLEHDMIELAGMAKDTVCRDMLVERLGLTKWKIIPGGASGAEPA